MRSTERILTTHTGSLPKPDDLVRMIWRRAAGEDVDEAALEKRVADAVKEIVDKQQEVGVDVINDGEAGKPGFSSYIYERYGGFGEPVEVLVDALDLNDFPELAQAFFEHYGEAVEHAEMRHCEGPIEYRGSDPVRRDIAHLASALGETPREMAFINAVTPGQITFNNPNAYYSSHEEYLQAAAEAVREEYREVIDAGFNLQLDSPDLAMAGHYKFGDGLGDHMTHVALAIEALNHSLEGLPAERVRLHLCWGNYPGAHNHDVPLGDIIEHALKARVGTISFEAANPAHQHEWQVFERVEVPEDKVLMPGVVDVLTQRIEHPEVVAQRIKSFADVVGREQVIAGTDCGFSTFAGLHLIPPSIAWAKLRSLSQGAELASGRLW